MPYIGAEIYCAYCTEPEHRMLALQLTRQIQQTLEPLFSYYGETLMVDFTAPIPAMTFEEFVRGNGYPCFVLGDLTTYPQLPELGNFIGTEQQNVKLLYKWFKNVLIKQQISPIFITDLPCGISPLIARKSTHTLHRTYLVVNGSTLMEIAQTKPTVKLWKASCLLGKSKR